MSWDVLAVRLPPNIKHPADITAGYEPPNLGSRENVVAFFSSKYEVRPTDHPEWIIIEGLEAAIEIHLHETHGIHQNEDLGIVNELTFHIHGGPDGPSFVLSTCNDLDLRAIEMQSGGFLTEADAGASYQEWLDHAGNHEIRWPPLPPLP